MKFTYKIAGLSIVSDFDLGPAYQNFITNNRGNADACCAFSEDHEFFLSLLDSNPVFSTSHEQFLVHSYPDGFLYESTENAGARLFSDLEYTCFKVIPGPGLEHLIRLVLESRLIRDGNITLHSACILTPLGAYAFTGPSGIGKSTRAAALVEAMNGDSGSAFSLLNGDRPLIDCISPTAYGVPWDGKEGLHICDSKPLRAVFCVKRLDDVGISPESSSCGAQPAEESLRLLTEKEAYKMLIKQIFLPMWDTDTAAAAMGNLKKLVSHLCIYELTSGPDSKSAKKSWELIKKEAKNEN